MGNNEVRLRSDLLGCKSGSIGWNLIPSEHISKPSGFTKTGEFLDQLIVDPLLRKSLQGPFSKTKTEGNNIMNILNY
jgi:hypothetical protein